MISRISVLSLEQIESVLDDAFVLLSTVGVKVHLRDALELLGDHGATVDLKNLTARIPRTLVENSLKSVPGQFALYSLDKQPTVLYGSGRSHFNPGSAAVNVLETKTGSHRPATTEDLVNLAKLVDQLPQYAAQSTAVVCSDVPREISDIYRLYLVLRHSKKPLVTGAFAIESGRRMFEMLFAATGSRADFSDRPIAIFDVCPTPPLSWSNFASQNLIDLAKSGVPVQLVSMPLAGAAAPVTLFHAAVQHAAETLSGIVLHQITTPGAPMVWGGAPAIFDMRHGTTPMAASETILLDLACAQVGQYLRLPTHTYLGATDAKIIDAQSGIDSGISLLLGALAGIDMISGPGLLDFLACQSLEKLLMDAETIDAVSRISGGIEISSGRTLEDFYRDFDFEPAFLRHPLTKLLFRNEQHLPTKLTDRLTLRSWTDMGKLSLSDRASDAVARLLASYKEPEFEDQYLQNLDEMMNDVARAAGMEQLPEIVSS